uniref:protein-tyrosine-phosphatase n=1 Tax=Romanomermis culicivorax TaxID=13658 RepID=A0A915KHB3_ROMCU
YITETFSNGLSTLRIEPVREKDNDSRISCHLDGVADKPGTSARLLVLKGDDLPQGFPQIQEDPKLRAVEKNHSATMTCSVRGQPMPRVLWLKDLAPVDMSNPRYSIATLGNPAYDYQIGKLCAAEPSTSNTGSLVIQNSEENDEGKYECVARNEKGVVHSRSAHLYVKVRRVPPQFSIPPKRVYQAPPGGKVEMNCVAFGHPMPRVFWRRSRTNEDLERPESAPVGKNVLVLNNVQKTENYSCVAFSSLGNINAESTVEVKALPDPPDQLKIVNVSAKSVVLTWSKSQPASRDDGVGPVKYAVRYKPKYSEADSYAESVATVDTRATVENLEPYTEYEFRVHTVVDLGRSRPSRPLEVTTLESLPDTAPKKVLSRPLTATNVVVQWEPPDKPNGRILAYKVYYNYREIEPYTSWPFKEISEGSMAQISDLKPEKLYTIKVQAKNSIGYGPVSDSVMVYTKTGTNLKAVPLNSTEVLVAWDPPLHPDFRFYVLTYNNSSPGSVKNIQVPSNITQYRIDSLKPHTEYSFQVKAVSARGEGVPSKRIFAKTGAAVPANAPQDVMVESLNSSAIRVIWEKPKPKTSLPEAMITKYKITVVESTVTVQQNTEDDDDDDDDDSTLTSATVLPSATSEPARFFEQSADKPRSIVINGLKPYTLYHVTVAAGAYTGWGPKSNPPIEI